MEKSINMWKKVEKINSSDIFHIPTKVVYTF